MGKKQSSYTFKVASLNETLSKVRDILLHKKEGHIDLMYYALFGDRATFRVGKDENGYYVFCFNEGVWQDPDKLYCRSLNEVVNYIRLRNARLLKDSLEK